MVDAKILIARAECGSCKPDKDNKLPMKWGMIVEIGANNVFICKDCLRMIASKADQVEVIEGKKNVVSIKKKK